MLMCRVTLFIHWDEVYAVRGTYVFNRFARDDEDGFCSVSPLGHENSDTFNRAKGEIFVGFPP